ncbi:NAD-binding protein [Methanospirillum sp. J.3.6.1-F.2.7.3]|jgi:nanoRNase/pAp phosphatase (c-di-AMP/oligoRNAs hydrolase)|uniref:NAD-binding protein n=2 Tax=Methanospirillum TaxID=2202 RepID=A0A8E7AYI2_9EURY|nr:MULTISPECIES: DHH family phosphoesterase [Methanospirillum]MDX8551098.1 DHH family phosphoesterase [Methanospirillum hungatei]QVV87758.1 NAD-binding protein [Methanospirillum sp. J.3.6.1-F.2.7.3]QXO95312.1 NAD-binding protein [Methanospirillum hungatei]
MPGFSPAPSPGIRTYLICGCGSVGYLILEELKKEGGRLLCMDSNPERVQELREQKIEAFLRDLTDSEMLQGIDNFDIAFVVSDNHEANIAGLKTIRKKYPKVHIVARAQDPINEKLLMEEGADLVLYPQHVVAKAAIEHLHRLEKHHLSRDLFALLASWSGVFGIVTHTNPDPDAIASAMALSAIAKRANPNLETRIIYDGIIGHQENRTLVNLLDIRMEKLRQEVLNECTHIALVDSKGPGANNGLIHSMPVDIIIDHHQEDITNLDKAHFIDIRQNVGACATILTEYLKELNIEPDEKVATALLYGIRADTKQFRRNVSPNDLEYAAYLLEFSDADLLEKIMSPQYSHETIDIIGAAIKNRKTRNGYLFSNVGFVRNRDALPQAADLLINLEGISTALVYGITEDAIIMSGRNRDLRLNLGNVMSEAFSDVGDAGGHATMAAASIPLYVFSHVKEKEELLHLVIDPVLQNFYRLVGLLEDEESEV